MTAPTPAEVISRMASGYWISQALHVAAKLEIADRLADGPKSVQELASACHAHPPSLYRLLRALASVGVFAETQPHTFQLTPLAEPLRADVPDSKRAMVLMMGEEQFRAWSDLLYCVQTGETGFERQYGMPIFQYLAFHPEKARTFDAAMVSIHGPETAAMREAYDFGVFHVLADLGGGNASVLIDLLQHHPSLRGILFDLPGVAAGAQQNLEAAGLADRCQVVGGSFFDEVPSGADAYLLRHIIHDWDEARCRQILANIRRVAAPHAKVLIVEHVIEPGNEPCFGKLLDLVMLVVPGGLERTADEYRALLASEGFRLDRIVPTTAGVRVLEASIE